jgi:carboxymethylenebutenolidase
VACGQAEAPVAAPTAAVAPEAPAPAPAPAPLPPPAAVEASVPLLEQALAYGEGQKTNLIGFLAMPRDAAEPLPGIILIHEWWGLNDATKDIARRLAAAGYVVLSVDLYGGQVATSPEQAQPLMAKLYEQPEAARINLRQAYDYLDKYALAPRIAAMGFGMGGGWALQTALMLPDTLDALVMYHGQMVVDRLRLAPLRMPILGFFGAEDRSLPVREVQEFRALLQEAGKIAEILIVPGADQGFATAGSPSFNAQAAADSWRQTVTFLDRNLRLTAAQ